MEKLFKVDSRRITLREYWNITPSWAVLIPWIAARFGVALPMGSPFPMPKSVREMEIPTSEFSPAAWQKLQPLFEQCEQLGFHSPRFHSHENLRGDARTSFISMLHRSGEMVLRLMHTRANNVTPPIDTVVVLLLSELSDGTYFFTNNQGPKFKNGPGVIGQRRIGRPPAELLEAHQQALTRLAAQNPPRSIPTLEALDDLSDRYEKYCNEFQIQRGLYRELTPNEVASELGAQESVAPMAEAGNENAGILTELHLLQNKKGGWGNALVIFFVSMFLFLAAGSSQWSWKYALMLVPILFVHELGHYLAMRAFNYRNLRMFFLPFFGAAVTGRHYNVPGWKKVIVFMMGPVPGIVFGAILGSIGLILHQPFLIQISLVTLILNGINLLPVLPMDGGWIFHVLLFSRHPVLDATFRGLAVVALVVVGHYTQNKILFYLSIPMLLGIPNAYRMARIAATLRREGLPAGSDDDQTIPVETAHAIIGELRKLPVKLRTNKMLAEQTLQIFESLNARPPGLLGTIGYLVAHVTSLGLALVFAAVLVVGQRDDFRRSFESAPLKHALPCDEPSLWRGSNFDPHVSPLTVVASFPRRVDAVQSFQQWTNRLPPGASLKLLGDSLLLSLPPGDERARRLWFGRLERETKGVFVDATNQPAVVSLSFRLPDSAQAKAMEQELNDYLSGELTPSLIPPWHPDDRRTPDERSAHQLARATYQKVETGPSRDQDDSRLRTLRQQIAAARRQADEAQVQALLEDLRKLLEEQESQRLQELRSGTDGPVDVRIIDLMKPKSAMATNLVGRKEWLRELAKGMGSLPSTGDQVSDSDARYSIHYGAVLRTGDQVSLQWTTFVRLSEGFPTLVQWLCARGATELKYDLQPGHGVGGDERE